MRLVADQHMIGRIPAAAHKLQHLELALLGGLPIDPLAHVTRHFVSMQISCFHICPALSLPSKMVA